MTVREYEALFPELAEQGFTNQDGVLPADLVENLYQEGFQAWQAGQFQEARVGHKQQPRRVPEIRRDSIHWLEPHAGPTARNRFLRCPDTRRLAPTQSFSLGVPRSEAHYAR